MVSFGFQDQDYLAVSIETRKEKGESYSTLAGFFRRYELYYVVADERDVIRVRTTYRQPQEDVYIYRARTPQRNIRQSFLDYLQSMNDMCVRSALLQYTDYQLHDDPSHAHADKSRVAADVVENFVSGYLPDYLYELGRIDTAKPFADLEKLSRVTERAQAADKDDASFSQRLRQGLPKPAPLP